MGFLSDIGGMLPAAYAGFNKGVDDVTARQQREADAKYQEELRARDREMAPVAMEAKKSALRAQIDNDKRAAEIAPGNHARLLAEQEHLNKVDPLRRSLEEWDAIRKESGSKATFIESAVPKLGESIHNNDVAGVNIGVKNLFDAGVFKDVESLQGASVAKSEIVQAPDGAVDFRGQPVKGRAIRATLSDGRQGFIGTDYMLAQYAKKLQAADLANIKPVKPGENLVNVRTGQVVSQGQPHLSASGYIDPETGEFIPTRPGAGGGTGSRSGAGGKAPASPQSAAVGFFATAAEKAETKLSPTQIAYGQRLAEQIATQRNGSGQPIPPAIAAEVAMEVALDPAKIQPQVNVQTGKIEGVFSRRDLGDVVVEPWSPALQRSFTPEQLTKAAEELIKAQPEAVRTEFVAAAHDPAARKALLDKVTQEIAAKVPAEQVQAYTQSTLASLSDKLDIVAKNTKPPPAKTDTSIRSRFGIGGMSVPTDYTPLPGTPPEVAERMLARGKAAAEESARKSAAETERREKESAAEAEGKKSVAHVTSGFVKSLTGTEARKLRNGTGWKYLDSDMRKLLTLQAGRSD